MDCDLALRETGVVDRHAYYKLHDDGKLLIDGWLRKGRAADDPYEAFIYLWIGFNAWAACVTNEDSDTRMVAALAHDRDLNSEFLTLLGSSARIEALAHAFHALWPIFRVQQLRELAVPYLFQQAGSRAEVVEIYLGAGATKFEPVCWPSHVQEGGAPLDWAHTIAAIYRVRCNLFHGEKARTSEDDTQIVIAARDVLAAFIQEARLAT